MFWIEEPRIYLRIVVAVDTEASLERIASSIRTFTIMNQHQNLVTIKLRHMCSIEICF